MEIYTLQEMIKRCPDGAVVCLTFKPHAVREVKALIELRERAMAQIDERDIPMVLEAVQRGQLDVKNRQVRVIADKLFRVVLHMLSTGLEKVELDEDHALSECWRMKHRDRVARAGDFGKLCTQGIRENLQAWGFSLSTKYHLAMGLPQYSFRLNEGMMTGICHVIVDIWSGQVFVNDEPGIPFKNPEQVSGLLKQAADRYLGGDISSVAD